MELGYDVESAYDVPSRAAVLSRYVLAVVITVAAILSQYALPQAVPLFRPLYQDFLGNLFVVYGIPILAFVGLVGAGPLRAYRHAMPKATWEGLRWFGLFSGLALVVSFVLVIVYTILDPSALELLNQPNPVVQAAENNPFFWVSFSFVVGAVEETIFRGWIFGFWRGAKGVPWWVHATWTSALFAGVHLYYAQTYGIASPLLYPTLFFLGFAFAATYQTSGGNLVVVALLHGGNDAASFLTIVSTPAADAVHFGIIGVGLLLALVQLVLGSPFEPRPPRPVLPPFGSDGSAWLPPPPPSPPPPPAPPGFLSPVRHRLVRWAVGTPGWTSRTTRSATSLGRPARSRWWAFPTSQSGTRTRWPATSKRRGTASSP